MSDDILVRTSGRVTEILLNRPDAGNGVTNEMAAALGNAIAGAGESHFVVLRGAGEDFCTGRAVMGHRPAGRPPAYERRAQNEVIFNCYGAFRRSAIPVVGVVQGRALGFGCALASLCDITLASDAATFQLPEMGHNIMPTMAMSSLVDRVPRKALMYLTYSTRAIDAPKALSFGIVSDVVPAADLETPCRRTSRGAGEGAAPGDHGGQGVRPLSAFDGYRKRGGFRPQLARDGQLGARYARLIARRGGMGGAPDEPCRSLARIGRCFSISTAPSSISRRPPDRSRFRIGCLRCWSRCTMRWAAPWRS